MDTPSSKRREASYQDVCEFIRELRDIQGQHGTWNCNSYMMGMYNGMECILACMEERDPVYKHRPKVWLDDLSSSENQPIASVASSEKTTT